MRLNQREQKMVNKACEQLQEAQVSCSARLFSKKDIEETIIEAKKAFDGLDRVERKWIKKLVAVNEYSIPISYKWSAKTSIIEVTLNRYGTLSSIGVYRESAPIKAYGGCASIRVECEYE